MVSIRYFCGVGEFCRVKSRPRGTMTSKTGDAGLSPASTKAKIQDTRNQEVSNLKGPSVEQDIAFARAPHNRPSVIPHACVSSDANHSSKPARPGEPLCLPPRRFPFHEFGRNQYLLRPHGAL